MTEIASPCSGCNLLTAPIGDKGRHYGKTIVYDKDSNTVCVGLTRVKE